VITSQGETAMDAGRLYQRSAWMRKQLRAATKDAAALTACSKWTADAAAKVAPAFAQASVIHNGVDVDDWQMNPPPGGLPEVAAWGRHVPQKDFDMLLDAWPQVIAEIPGARLLLGGSGPQTSALGSRTGGSVEFLGPLDRPGVRELLARSTIAVVPSRIEPFGIVAVEALAAGRWLVYAAGSGLVEAAGTCGRPVDVRNSDALAAAIVLELRDPTPTESGRAERPSYPGIGWPRSTGRSTDG